MMIDLQAIQAHNIGTALLGPMRVISSSRGGFMCKSEKQFNQIPSRQTPGRLTTSARHRSKGRWPGLLRLRRSVDTSEILD